MYIDIHIIVHCNLTAVNDKPSHATLAIRAKTTRLISRLLFKIYIALPKRKQTKRKSEARTSLIEEHVDIQFSP